MSDTGEDAVAETQQEVVDTDVQPPEQTDDNEQDNIVPSAEPEGVEQPEGGEQNSSQAEAPIADGEQDLEQDAPNEMPEADVQAPGPEETGTDLTSQIDMAAAEEQAAPAQPAKQGFRQQLLLRTNSTDADNNNLDNGPGNTSPEADVALWSTGAAASAQQPAGEPASPVYITQSAPTTPSGMQHSTMRSRKVAAIRKTGSTFRTDPLALAKRLVEEREFNDRLCAEMGKKTERATMRRSTHVPPSQTTSLSPVSLVIKTYPGWVPHPPGWKSTFDNSQHKEVSAIDHQISRELLNSQQRDRQRFGYSQALKQAEEQAAAARQAQVQAEIDARREQRMQKEAAVAAAAAAAQEQRRQQAEAKVQAKLARSAQLISTLAREREAEAARQQQEREQRRQAALQSVAELDSIKQAIYLYELSRGNGKRSTSAEKRRAEGTQHLDRKAKEMSHKAQVMARGEQMRSQSQQRARERWEAVEAGSNAAAAKKGAALRQRSEVVAMRAAERDATWAERAAELERIHGNKAWFIQERAEQMHRTALEREREARDQEAEWQRKSSMEAFAAHWAKELEYEAAVKKRVPELRADVKATLERMGRPRGGASTVEVS